MTTSPAQALTALKELMLSERSAESLDHKKWRRNTEVAANPNGFPKRPVGNKPIDPQVWPHNKIRKLKSKASPKVDPLDEPELGERSPAERVRRGVVDRPPGSAGSKRQAKGTPRVSSDVLAGRLPAEHVLRAQAHKKAGIDSPLLHKIRRRRLTPEELDMSEHAMLNEETGELEVSDEVCSLLDGMVEVLESAGYEIEDGMEAEEFVEQVGEVLETDEDLDAAKRQALVKSYNAMADVIESVRAEMSEEEEEEDDDSDDDDEKDSDEKDSDEKDSDEKDSDEKSDKKPFFLKKAKKDDDAEEAAEGDEADEAAEDEKAESITAHTMKHAAQKGYSPGWSAHKAGHPGVPAKNKHGAYTIHSVRPNSKPRRAKVGQKKLPRY